MRLACRPSALRLIATRPSCRLNFRPPAQRCLLRLQHRNLLTLAIETSCDDTCVALLSKHPDGSAALHYNRKRTSDNRMHGGVKPTVALEGHISNLADMVRECLPFLPDAATTNATNSMTAERNSTAQYEGSTPAGATNPRPTILVNGREKQKPDFISVTRGPGMAANLSIGLSTAKGLAASWQVPLVAVNHMQAHALTPRLVEALERGDERKRAAREAQVLGLTPGASAAQDVVATSTNTNATTDTTAAQPRYPFLSLLVSGGHTMLVHSRGLNDHRILASALSLAIGDMIDKAARLILPADVMRATENVMYGRALETFAFPPPTTAAAEENQGAGAGPGADHEYDYGYVPARRRHDEVKTYTSPHGWHLKPPLSQSRRMAYDFSALGTEVKKIMEARPEMSVDERRDLARHVMRMCFEHLASRVIFALDAQEAGHASTDEHTSERSPSSENGEGRAVTDGDGGQAAPVKTLVVSGGVASNRYLRHILRSILDERGHERVEVTAPPPALCTDNAAMIAWTGMEMYEAGYESDLSVLMIRKWPLDPTGEDGGILGVPGWIKRGDEQIKPRL